jgi:hypothetical protein
MAKNEKFGTCKLCRLQAKLCRSHYLPKGVYGILQQPDLGFPHPVIMSESEAKFSSDQLTDYVLCTECEHRLNVYGEAWVLANIYQGISFPLRDALLRSQPMCVEKGENFYAGGSIKEIDVDKLVYFAMSMFWRGAAHHWEIRGTSAPEIDLGPFEKEIRHYLLGGRFPEKAALNIAISAAAKVLTAAFLPRRSPIELCHSYVFYVPGISFRLLLGKRIPEGLKTACAQTSKARFIVLSAAVDDNLESVAAVDIALANPVNKLSERLRIAEKQMSTAPISKTPEI